MKKFTLLIGLLLLIQGFARGETPATQPTTQPALKETEPVRVNGLDFQLVGPAVWVLPTKEKVTPIPLSLKITNRTDKDIQFNPDGGFNIVLREAVGKEAVGRELPHFYISQARAQAVKHPPMTIAKGQSITLDRTAQLGQAIDKPDTFWLSGPEFGQIGGLKVGPYTIAMTYENADAGPKDAPCWVGKVTTKELAMHIGVPTVVVDGLQVTVTPAKATFAADEPLKFTVQFKNVSDKPFLLSEADYFWHWGMYFEDMTKNVPWQFRELGKGGRGAFEPVGNPEDAIPLKPGEIFNVPVELISGQGKFDFMSAVHNHIGLYKPLEQLPPGKYRLTTEISLREKPIRQGGLDWAFWMGTIKTEPVEFEILDKTAAGEQKQLTSLTPAPEPTTQAATPPIDNVTLEDILSNVPASAKPTKGLWDESDKDKLNEWLNATYNGTTLHASLLSTDSSKALHNVDDWTFSVTSDNLNIPYGNSKITCHILPFSLTGDTNFAQKYSNASKKPLKITGTIAKISYDASITPTITIILGQTSLAP